MGGEQTDLLWLLEDLEIDFDASSQLAEHVEAYADQLHAALLRRNEMLVDIDAEIDLAMYEGRHERALALADRLTKSRLAIRAVNDQFSQLLATAIPDDKQAAFRETFLQTSYPRVYRRTLAQSSFDDARKLTDLDDSVRQSIEELAASYLLELGELNDRICRAIREEDASRLTQTLQNVIDSMKSDPADGVTIGRATTIADDFRRRQQLDVRYMKSLHAMLSPQQVAKLPRVPELDVTEPVRGEHEIVGTAE